MTCNHRSKTPRLTEPYRCGDCGTEICPDCGSQPTWWFGKLITGLSYCKYDISHNGYSTTLDLQLDPDLILKICGNNPIIATQVVDALRNENWEKLKEILKTVEFKPCVSQIKKCDGIGMISLCSK